MFGLPGFVLVASLVFNSFARNKGSDKTSVLISLKFEISRQLQRSRECMEQAKRAGTNGHDLD